MPNLEFLDAHWLSLLIFLPFSTALVLFATGRRLPESLWRVTGLIASLLTALVSLRLLRDYDLVDGEMQFVERLAWIAEYGVNYSVGLDGISLVFVLLMTFLTPLILIATWRREAIAVRSFVLAVLAFESAVLGVLSSLNLVLFYVFWEAALLPLFFLHGVWASGEQRRSTIEMLGFSLFGSLPMFLAILVLGQFHFEQFGARSFELMSLDGLNATGLLDLRLADAADLPWWKTQSALFAAFFLACAVRIPLVPFHRWAAHVHAHSSGASSALLVGCLAPVGVYPLVRFVLPLFPDAVATHAPWLSTFLSCGVLYAAFLALAQRDLKQLLGYAATVNAGLVVLGVLSATAHGISGALLHSASVALSTAVLFLLVEFLVSRRGVHGIADFGGVTRPMPVFALFFGIALLASVGLPGLSGFVGFFLILLGTLTHSTSAAIAAAAALLVLACAMLLAFRRVFFGPVEQAENRGLIDLGQRERAVILVALIPMLWIGLYPHSTLRRLEPSAVAQLRQMRLRAELERQEPEQVQWKPALRGVQRELASLQSDERLSTSSQREAR